MELDGFAEVREKIFGAVAARIKMEFMRDFLFRQLFVHLLSRSGESVLIVLPAVYVDCLSFELRLMFER